MQAIDNKTETLADFVQQCKDRLKKILERLEWSEEMVKKNFNTNSLASKSTTKQPREVKPSKIPEYPNSCCNQNNLVLDTTKLRELLQDYEVEAPRNFQELQANFNREQKLKIYQHVIENTKTLNNNLETPVAEGELSLAEIVAQKKREEKRKKRKFRKSKPTHIEEVRCLVKLQMKALRQFLIERNGNEMDTINKSRSKSPQKVGYKEYNDNVRQKSQNCESRTYEKKFTPIPSKELTKYSKRNISDMDTINKSRSNSPQKEGYKECNDNVCQKSQNCESRTYDKKFRNLSPIPSKELTKYSKRNISDMDTINKSKRKSPQRKEYKEYNDKANHKSQQSRNDKEFRKTSPTHSKELTKHGNYSHGSSKDLKNSFKRDSRSRSKDLNSYRRKRGTSKESHKSRERKHYEKSSRELNHKHKRRSRSSSYDRRTYKSYYRSKIDRSRSPHFNSYRSRRSRSNSPYSKEMKRINYHKSDSQKRRSISRESKYSKVYKEEETTSKISKSKHSTSRDHDYRRYPKEDTLNDYKAKDVDHYQKSSKHKHTKDKKKTTEKRS